ncbi:hypothetical protein [Variovorax paradoxus]|uniref:Uncharacterized protein n=1 Tax=Variovorax paradoxus TaxID=34073 RepID=A0A0H2MFT6_VARPD|nr:hypothetical protein [Variovorax paradoxus]KLN55700.1 hypothetical protein VPARA_30660 [Variovorax paradoxus]
MPLFRLRSAPPAFLAVLLLSTFGTAAPASAANAVLTLDTDRAQEDTQTPALDLALTRFAGMASGSYYWPEGLLAEQLISGLSSRRDRKQQALPGGQRLLSSYRRPYGGSERAAVLLDDRGGDVLAAALVHRQCGKGSASTGCLDAQHAVLSIFLRPGVDRAKAQPLFAWSRQVPEDLQSGDGEKIAKTEYATMDAAHTAARPVERPKGFSAAVPLYPKSQIHRTAQDALSDAKARRVLRLQTTDSMAQVLAFYKQLTPPLEDMESGLDERNGYVAGSRKGLAFSVNVKHDRDMPAITNIEVEMSE